MINKKARVIIAWLKKQNSDYSILYVAYVVFIGSVFLTNSLTAPNWLFLWLVLPLALTPTLVPALSYVLFSVQAKAPWRLALNFHSCRLALPWLTFHSLLFWAAALYLLLLALSSLSQQSLDLGYLRRDFIVWFEIAAMLLVTALLVIRRRKFTKSFFTHTSALAAVSALINMVAFAWRTPFPESLDDYRLVPILGMPPHFGPTTVSLTYAIYFAGASATLVENGLSRLHRWSLTVSATILLIGILWTQTRSALLAVIAVMAALAPSFSRKARLATGLAAVMGVLIFVATPLGRHIVARGTSGRLELWQKYSQMAAERLWLGYGQFSMYGSDNINLRLEDGQVVFHPHNLVLSAQIRAGIFAAASMATILLGGLYWGWRYWRLTESMVPFCLMLTLSVAGMFDYELVASYPTWPWITFWVPIGICLGAEWTVQRTFLSSVASSSGRSNLDTPVGKNDP